MYIVIIASWCVYCFVYYTEENFIIVCIQGYRSIV